MRTTLHIFLNDPVGAPPSETGRCERLCFHFVSLCVSLLYSPALGRCWLSDCHQNQWARDKSLKSIPAGGFAHSMSKHTEALYLKPDGDTAPCSRSAQTKSHLCSHVQSQFSQQFLCIARSECHHKQILSAGFDLGVWYLCLLRRTLPIQQWIWGFLSSAWTSSRAAYAVTDTCVMLSSESRQVCGVFKNTPTTSSLCSQVIRNWF